MAQALCDANTSAAFVALNADLTVSLSRLMIKTLKLLDPTGEAGAGDAGEDARVCQLDDPHAVVRDTCAVAEPLFSDRTPLVLRNELEPGELAFVPRDTFQCCLYALVYRAGTRILRGRCVMTARSEDPEGGFFRTRITPRVLLSTHIGGNSKRVVRARPRTDYSSSPWRTRRRSRRRPARTPRRPSARRSSSFGGGGF